MARGCKGFSLIELLVAISIIAILIGILLPALSGARSSAHIALCLGQQQQLMVAVQSYSMDHDGRIPYGPDAAAPSPANFYPVTGMVTSLLSRPPGDAVGAGLMLDRHLDHKPELVFCPGADDPIDAAHELSLVGTDWAISNYYYRHGSNTQAANHGADHILLENLGKNKNGRQISTIFIDQNFKALGGAFFKVLQPRSNHRETVANAAYSDGHAESLNNDDLTYSIDVGFFPTKADSEILAVMEKADEQ